MKNTPMFIKGIDWTKLRKQKEILIGIAGGTLKTFDNDSLDGIVSLIDAIQDYVVDMGIFPEDCVFGSDNETELLVFANNAATMIVEELIESDGFYNDSDVPSKFIAKIMSTQYHINQIGVNIQTQIYNDLKETPIMFTYGDDGCLKYDSSMRENYEGIATLYYRTKFKESKMK